MSPLKFAKPRKKKPRPRRFGSSLPVGEKTPRKARKPVKARNDARRKREFARCYGSAERVAWIQAQPSIVSAERPCVNAHVRNGGMGRKADAKWIVPLTDQEHRELHGWGLVVFETLYMLDLDAEAAKIEARWQSHVAVHPERK